MTKNSELLVEAAEIYGYNDVFDMMESVFIDSVVPGICECGYTTEVEPDGVGWCEECNKPSCYSVLRRYGVI